VDPFDYATENRLIQLLTTTCERLRDEAPVVKYDQAHPNPLPKRPEDLKQYHCGLNNRQSCSPLAQAGGRDAMRYRSACGGQKRRRLITCG
jgi:hypothetical protein